MLLVGRGRPRHRQKECRQTHQSHQQSRAQHEVGVGRSFFGACTRPREEAGLNQESRNDADLKRARACVEDGGLCVDASDRSKSRWLNHSVRSFDRLLATHAAPLDGPTAHSHCLLPITPPTSSSKQRQDLALRTSQTAPPGGSSDPYVNSALELDEAELCRRDLTGYGAARAAGRGLHTNTATLQHRTCRFNCFSSGPPAALLRPCCQAEHRRAAPARGGGEGAPGAGLSEVRSISAFSKPPQKKRGREKEIKPPTQTANNGNNDETMHARTRARHAPHGRA